jgi:hypothetical protein
MAIKSNAIIQGVATRITERKIAARPASPGVAAREAMSFVNVLVVGDYTLADVTIGRGVEAPTRGEFITALVEIDVYREDDQMTIVEYIEDGVLLGAKGGK